jgi:hypothetical protein
MKAFNSYAKLALIISIIALFAGCEQGNGIISTRTFDLASFDKIDLKRTANVYVTQGATQSVSIEGEENILDLIKTEVTDDEWIFDFTKTVSEYETLTITITMTDIRRLRNSGSGDFYLGDSISVDDLDLEVNGSGNINGPVAISNKLKTVLTGSGTLDVSGAAAEHEATSSGSGNILTRNLVAATGEAHAGETGNVEVHYTGDWHAYITSSGNILYKGVAPVDSHVTGSGTVTEIP